jgi:hypothetical protein
MSTHPSRYFEQQRLALGLKPGQLAQRAGCKNIPKSGHRIRTFESTGSVSRSLFEKLVLALGVPSSVIKELAEQDQREFFAKWLVWVNQPIQPYLVVRLMPAIYSQTKVPPEITTMEEAEQWASSFAAKMKRSCCLVWSRRISSWFREDGTIYDRTEAVPGQPNVPFLKLGGKTFAVASDLRTFTSVSWPKKPETCDFGDVTNDGEREVN